MTAPGQMTTRIHREVRGKRYGEVLLVKSGDDGLFAEVFNSFTLNECPQELWEKLDMAAIAESGGALAAVANGPRYWLMDAIEKSGPEVPEVHDFGGILMTRAAVLNFGTAGLDPSPYKGRRVARTAVFSFGAGSTVYELTDPDGAVYVMQSWCTSEDTALGESDLAALGERLALPTGWSYGFRRLSEDLNVMTSTEDAVVLQDDLKNSYCLAV
jgi:hypothetical protein